MITDTIDNWNSLWGENHTLTDSTNWINATTNKTKLDWQKTDQW